jgi:hypothetical protein
MSFEALILGHVRDSTIVHVRTQNLGIRVAFLDIGEYLVDGSIEAASGQSIFRARGRAWSLDEFPCIYQRAYAALDASPQARSRLLALETGPMSSASEVINRPFGGWQNLSKPFQLLMLQDRFTVPPSRSTSIPDDYRLFREAMSDVIYKSNSGERSIVDRITPEHDGRTQRLATCPVLFQRQIIGDDVRVHVCRGEAFAVRISSDAVDYRYYKARGSFAHLEPQATLPEEIRAGSIAFAATSGVALAGFDFKVDADGHWYCLEMNPSPAFESYDHALDGVIARRLVEGFRMTTVGCPG